jgi:glycosyltransferase involved in cell wall biosynthesis
MTATIGGLIVGLLLANRGQERTARVALYIGCAFRHVELRMDSQAAIFIVPSIDGARPQVANVQLDAWRARGLEIEVFEWRGAPSSPALTERLCRPVAHLISSGFDDERLEAIDRATANWGTATTVFFEQLPDESRATRRVREDERFIGVARDAKTLERLGERGVLLGHAAHDDEVRLLQRRWTRPATPPAEPVLTIAVPAFNAGALLERSVGSLIAADVGSAIEVLVVDDGSTDDTGARADALAAATPGTVRVLHQPNRGHGGAINAALAAARGGFFRVLDADDRVEPLALKRLVASLASETVDLVLTEYAEVRPQEALPRPVDLLGRLAPGAIGRVETLADPLLGVSSWAVILATSTFRTAKLRAANLRLTEKSPYVDLEYVVLGLEYVDTYRAWHDELYRYSLGADGQSVSEASYRRNVDRHEAVLCRLCAAMAEPARWSPGKRKYIVERVLQPIARRHLEILDGLESPDTGLAAFRRRMAAYPFVELPAPVPRWKRKARTFARRVIPPALRDAWRRWRER